VFCAVEAAAVASVAVSGAAAPGIRANMRAHGVLWLSFAFWATGAVVCLSLCAETLLVKAAADVFSAERERWPWARWASLGGGLALGALQALLVLMPFARRDSARILALERPRWFRFFPPRALALVLCVALSCAAAQRLTAQHYASVLTFIALLGAIGLALLAGAARLGAAACCAPERATAAAPLLASAAPGPDSGSGGPEAEAPAAADRAAAVR
jgi:hypothetical protein